MTKEPFRVDLLWICLEVMYSYFAVKAVCVIQSNPFVRISRHLKICSYKWVSYKWGFCKGNYITDGLQGPAEHSLCWSIRTSGVRTSGSSYEWGSTVYSTSRILHPSTFIYEFFSYRTHHSYCQITTSYRCYSKLRVQLQSLSTGGTRTSTVPLSYT